MDIQWDLDGWSDLVKDIVDTKGVEMMTRVADACNQEIVQGAMKRKADKYNLDVEDQEALLQDSSVQGAIVRIGKGYMVSVQGEEPLEKRNYRATVITASRAAMYDNAKNQTLLRNFHLASDGGT